MILQKIIVLFCIPIIFNGNTDYHDPKQPSPVKISVDLDNTQDDISSLFSSCKIVPLETNPETVFGRVGLIEVHNNQIYIMDRNSQTLISFDTDGKFITNFFRLGKGPGETASIMSFMVDEENEEVALNSWEKKKNIFFNLNGKYLREEKSPIHNEGMFRLDSSHTAYYTGRIHNIIDNKKDMSFVIVLDDANNITFKGIENDVIKESAYVLAQSFSQGYEDVLVKYPYNNIVYKVSPRSVSPKYEIDFGKDNIEWDDINVKEPTLIHSQIIAKNKASIHHWFWEFDEYLFFAAKRGRERFYVHYNKTTREVKVFNSNKSKNTKFGSLGWICGATKNGIISYLEPMDLLFPDNPLPNPSDKIFREDFNSILEKLEKTDNPLLLFYKF